MVSLVFKHNDMALYINIFLENSQETQSSDIRTGQSGIQSNTLSLGNHYLDVYRNIELVQCIVCHIALQASNPCFKLQICERESINSDEYF